MGTCFSIGERAMGTCDGGVLQTVALQQVEDMEGLHIFYYLFLAFLTSWKIDALITCCSFSSSCYDSAGYESLSEWIHISEAGIAFWIQIVLFFAVW